MAIREERGAIGGHCCHLRVSQCNNLVASNSVANHKAFRTSSGAFVSLIAMPVAAMGEVGDVGRRIGMSITLTAIGAVAGPPISGAIRVSTGSFKLVGVYAGKVSFRSCRTT
jgi:hypothetical protein